MQLVERVHEDCAFYCLDRAGKSCGNGAEITWLGTAAIRLEADGETVLFDPFVQLVGGENPNCLDDFLQDQTICVTHGHLDHMMDVPEFLDPESDAEATVYCGEVAAGTLSVFGGTRLWRTPAT